MQHLLSLIISIVVFATGCTSVIAESPTVLNHKNIETFWNYCTACIQGSCKDVEVCKKRMDSKFLISTFNIAISRGDLNAIIFLLDVVKIDPNAIIEDRYKTSALGIISYYPYPGAEKIADVLIHRGADVNHIMSGHARTPLLTAIWKHNNPVARLLLKNGADPKIPSDRGWDACLFAHRYSNFEIMPNLPGCCQWLLDIQPSDDLPEAKLHPPEFLRYCKK